MSAEPEDIKEESALKLVLTIDKHNRMNIDAPTTPDICISYLHRAIVVMEAHMYRQVLESTLENRRLTDLIRKDGKG